MNKKVINPFGYAELYEWQKYPGDANRFARFVQFDKNLHDRICLARDKDMPIIGVSSINYVTTSNNPENWHARYKCNEYGDIYMRKERLAVGKKNYDQLNEFSYIMTFPYEQYIPVENENFDTKLSKSYKPRIERLEWSSVVLCGKAIVKDDGNCSPGNWCKPKYSDNYDEAGIATPCNKDDNNSFYVMQRISDHSIMILVK